MGIGPLGATAPVSGGGSASGGGTGATTPGGSLGQNAFLQLLVAQLKYQDPLQPMNDTQFVTQLAQFQMLSVLEEIKTGVDRLDAAQSGAAAATGKQGSG